MSHGHEEEGNVGSKIEESFKGGTDERSVVKLISKNASRTAVWVFWSLVVLITIFSVFADLKTESKSTSSSQETMLEQTQNTTNTPEHTAKWKETAEDGSLPVGVWSESFKIEPGCETRFDGGNGTVYKIQYRLYSSEWKDHEPGEFPKGNEIRFILLQEGVTEVPVKVICS